MTTASDGRHFGFECEVAGGSYDVLAQLVKRDLALETDLHLYHCDCSDCDPWRKHAAITGQEDCTVDGELISKVLTYGTDEHYDVLDGLSASLLEGRAIRGTGAGFHVHVDRRDLTELDHLRLYRMFLRYQDDLGTLASASYRQVRDYNSRLDIAHLIVGRDVDHPSGARDRYGTVRQVWRAGNPAAFWTDDTTTCSRPPKGAWLAASRDTVEFRLWNQSLAGWRMRMAIGVSVAMVNAAKGGVAVTKNDPRDLTDVIGDHLDADTLGGVIRQANLRAKKG